MDEIKNLVKDYLLEQNIINSDNLLYSYYYNDVEWHAYKEQKDIMFYVSYDLIKCGLGYAYCVRIICDNLKYNIEPIFYSKSFTNSTTGEWDKMPHNLKEKFLSDALKDLKTYG